MQMNLKKLQENIFVNYMPRKKIYTQEELDEKRRAYQREYTKRKYVRKRINKTVKLYREKNRDIFNDKKSNYRKKLRQQDPIYFVGDAIKWSARKRGLEAPHTNKQYRDWFNSQDKVCTYCGSDYQTINKYLDKIKIKFRSDLRRLAIDRKNSSRGYSFDNMVLACYLCNTSKQAIFSHKDFLEIGKNFIRPKIKKILS